MESIPVMIVGAGPTGLVLALWLTKIGIRVRIIDKTSQKLTTSRAIAIHARTLEFYRQLEIDDVITEASFRFPAVNLWVDHVRKARFALSDFGKGITPFPYVYILPQDQHEEILIKKLEELGVTIERNSELTDFAQDGNKVEVKVRRSDGSSETISAEFLAGCDGAHSVVRKKMDVGFDGSTYPNLFFVADVSGSGPALNGELHVSLDQSEFMAFFPLKQKGHARLIGILPDNPAKAPSWNEVNPRLLNEMEVSISEVRWFSSYHVHHRFALHFQEDRVFLLGDAAHIHSPLGAQGMNTGIGDAVNLAWKLGDVLKKRTDRKILLSYESERIRFAKQLVQTTDRAFQFISSNGPLAKLVRTRIVPALLPRLLRSKRFGRFVFRRISQTSITYRTHSVSNGSGLQVGDRLPWLEAVDNFKLLQSMDWQVHVYGSRVIKDAGSVVHQFPWRKDFAAKGIEKNAAYLIRPDGHIHRTY